MPIEHFYTVDRQLWRPSDFLPPRNWYRGPPGPRRDVAHVDRIPHIQRNSSFRPEFFLCLFWNGKRHQPELCNRTGRWSTAPDEIRGATSSHAGTDGPRTRVVSPVGTLVTDGRIFRAWGQTCDCYRGWKFQAGIRNLRLFCISRSFFLGGSIYLRWILPGGWLGRVPGDDA